MVYDENWDDSLNDEEIGVEPEDYKAPTQYRLPPPRGKYVVEGVEGRFTLGNKGGAPYVKKAAVQIVEGDHKGTYIDAFISGRERRFGDPGTDMDDFLRGGGLKPENGRKFTQREVGEGVTATWQNRRTILSGLNGYCKACGTRFYDKHFVVTDNDGKKAETPVIECECGATITARPYVRRWFVA